MKIKCYSQPHLLGEMSYHINLSMGGMDCNAVNVNENSKTFSCKKAYFICFCFVYLIYQGTQVLMRSSYTKGIITVMTMIMVTKTTRQIWGIWKLRPAYSPETPNSGQKRWCFVPCDLEIWWMTLENNRAPLLCCFKLCATFHNHQWIQTGVAVQKRPISVKFDDF